MQYNFVIMNNVTMSFFFFEIRIRKEKLKGKTMFQLAHSGKIVNATNSMSDVICNSVKYIGIDKVK